MDEQGGGSAEDLAAYFLSGEGLRDVGSPRTTTTTGPGTARRRARGSSTTRAIG
ncbi:hypothetical protein [Parafrankia soli]|uniref:hypothetical protein n=1 Tax=Parafrankia soli TaxID=2599596 RepID=UPI000B02FEC5|nr:hypothetical protein [Parafrankia soli]